MARGISVGFYLAAFFTYVFPEWKGFLDIGPTLTPGERVIFAAILFVGATILFVMPERRERL